MITCMKMKSFILKYASKLMFYDVNIACYHTTNPTDAKIEPQIALISIDFSDSFSGLILGFKGAITFSFLTIFMTFLPQSVWN